MTEVAQAITVADVDASIARVIQSAESIWDEWAWQVENQTWLIGNRWSSWDEMRRAAYGNLHSITAPRAERPELVSRFRRAGLTQKETAETLGVNQATVSRHDEPTYTPRKPNMQTHIDREPDDVIDAEVIDDGEPVHVNRETGEVTDEPEREPDRQLTLGEAAELVNAFTAIIDRTFKPEQMAQVPREAKAQLRHVLKQALKALDERN